MSRLVLLVTLLLCGTAHADADAGSRSSFSTWGEVWRQRSPSSRLFAMPSAEVVGAFQLSLSGDASLLTESNTLSLSGLAALGFGDIAQIEYRHSSALRSDSDRADKPFVLPTIGVQVKLPYRAEGWVPATAVALRYGLEQPSTSPDGTLEHLQTVTDLYLVGRIEPHRRLRLHGGLRVAVAKIESQGLNAPPEYKETVFLPAGGWEFLAKEDTTLVGELALVPRFSPGEPGGESDVGAGIFGRLGLRWRVVPSFVLDASLGYRIEVQRFQPDTDTMANAFVDWDIRVGGELFIPWGAIACRGLGVLCTD